MHLAWSVVMQLKVWMRLIRELSQLFLKWEMILKVVGSRKQAKFYSNAILSLNILATIPVIILLSMFIITDLIALCLLVVIYITC